MVATLPWSSRWPSLGLPAALLPSLLLGCATTAPLPPPAARLNEEGAAALARHDLVAAEARFAVALEYSPRFVEAWVNLGLVELQRGNLDLARRHFLRARSINGDLPAPHHALGLLADRRGLGREAEQHYGAALRVDPGFAPARANLGRRLFARGAYDEGRLQFLRLTEAAPQALEGWLGLVECLLRLHREGEADEVLARTKERFGEGDEVALLFARQALRVGEPEEAEARLGALVERLSPSKLDDERAAAVWAWLAVARAARGDVHGAREAATKALLRDGANGPARHVLAAEVGRPGAP